MQNEEESQQQPHPITSSEQEDQRAAALFGPAGPGDFKKGDCITFSSKDTGYKELTGRIEHVRASAPAIKGGRVLPAGYIVIVPEETMIRFVFPGDVIVREERKN